MFRRFHLENRSAEPDERGAGLPHSLGVMCTSALCCLAFMTVSVFSLVRSQQATFASNSELGGGLKTPFEAHTVVNGLKHLTDTTWYLNEGAGRATVFNVGPNEVNNFSISSPASHNYTSVLMPHGSIIEDKASAGHSTATNKLLAVHSIAIDRNLFKDFPLQGCATDKGSERHFDAWCLIAIQEEIMSKCSDSNARWCSASAPNSTPDSCLHLVTHGSVSGLALALNSASANGDDNYFCARPLKSLLAIDSVNRRLFFIERTKGRSSAKDAATPTNSQDTSHPRRTLRFLSSVKDAQLDRLVDFFRRLRPRRLFGLAGQSNVSTDEKGGLPLQQFRSSQLGHASKHTYHTSTDLNPNSPFCIREFAFEASKNVETAACFPVPRPTSVQMTERDPVHLRYDADASTLSVYEFDSQGNLLLTAINTHTTPMSFKFATSFYNMKSAWILGNTDTPKGKSLLLGDRPPYSGVLHIIDLLRGSLNAMDISTMAISS